MKMVAEKVLAIMKQEIDECDALTYPDEPEKKFLGRRGSFYFPEFPEEWPDSSIICSVDVKTKVNEKRTWFEENEVK